MTTPEPSPLWSDPTSSDPTRPSDQPSPWQPPAQWSAPAPTPAPAAYPAVDPYAAPSPYPAAGPAPDANPYSAYPAAPVDAPAPFVGPDAGRTTDYSAGAAPVAAPMSAGTPEGGYGQSAYPVTSVASPTYAGYGAAPTYQPAYPGYAYPMYPPPVKNNGMAIGAMVTSLAGVALLACYGVGGLIGVVGAILGHVARRQIKATKESGDGMALAGIIVGWISLALAVLFWVGLVIFFVWAANQSTANDTTYPYVGN